MPAPPPSKPTAAPERAAVERSDHAIAAYMLARADGLPHATVEFDRPGAPPPG